MAENEYLTPEHALAYLAMADGIPHRVEGEAVLLSFIPPTSKRILDLGTGDGRLLALLRTQCPNAKLVGIDFSPTMLAAELLDGIDSNELALTPTQNPRLT